MNQLMFLGLGGFAALAFVIYVLARLLNESVKMAIAKMNAETSIQNSRMLQAGLAERVSQARDVWSNLNERYMAPEVGEPEPEPEEVWHTLGTVPLNQPVLDTPPAAE